MPIPRDRRRSRALCLEAFPEGVRHLWSLVAASCAGKPVAVDGNPLSSSFACGVLSCRASKCVGVPFGGSQVGAWFALDSRDWRMITGDCDAGFMENVMGFQKDGMAVHAP